MKKRIIRFLAILIPALSISKNIAAQVQNPDFKQKIDSYLSYSVPIITVDQLNQGKSKYLILDAREEEEYGISHIADAQFFGFKDPDYTILEGVSKDKPIVLYCSIGYRSEKIGEKLKKRGFSNVKNLYGSIFEWVNEGLPIVTPDGKITNQIHTYNKKWGQWMENSTLEKVY